MKWQPSPSQRPKASDAHTHELELAALHKGGFMTSRGFDPKCLELAEHFLADSFDPSRGRNGEELAIVNELAQTIQDAAEDYLRGKDL